MASRTPTTTRMRTGARSAIRSSRARTSTRRGRRATTARLPSGAVKQGYQLIALKDNGNKTYTLTFQVGPKMQQVTADHVVRALPFSTLRDVDLTHSNLSPRKMQAIQTLGMGQNAKIHVQVQKKPWPRLGYSGVSYTDRNG